jgi:pyruvate,water dikinase
VDLGSFLSSFTRTLSFSQAAPDKVGRNLAVIGRRYLNLGLRLGYHSSWIVAQISDVLEENYATFTFLGGVTHVTRRSRRARFLADILERFDFRTDVRGDMVTARFKNGQPARMQEQLRLLGWLIGYTRQLDVQMYDDEQVDACVADFLQRVQKNREAGDDRYC